MKVFGTGFGRTGTMSLKIALEKLGFGPCYHMTEIVIRPSHIKKWHNISIGNKPEWDQLFNNFNSGVDYPVCLFYKELSRKYPDAKFILTMRDFDAWYKSTKNTVYTVPTMLPDWFQKLILPLKRLISMQDNLIWSGLFKDNFSDRKSVQIIYNKHIEDLKKTIPSDRLLLYSVHEGWGPLCKFLNVDRPDNISFPKVNSTNAILRNFAIIKMIPYLLILSIIAILYFFFIKIF